MTEAGSVRYEGIEWSFVYPNRDRIECGESTALWLDEFCQGEGHIEQRSVRSVLGPWTPARACDSCGEVSTRTLFSVPHTAHFCRSCFDRENRDSAGPSPASPPESDEDGAQ